MSDLKREQRPMHSATVSLLRFFEHLPDDLQEVSKPFCELAHRVALASSNAETTVCIRKLLEAKDCAVRAALPATE